MHAQSNREEQKLFMTICTHSRIGSKMDLYIWKMVKQITMYFPIKNSLYRILQGSWKGAKIKEDAEAQSELNQLLSSKYEIHKLPHSN